MSRKPLSSSTLQNDSTPAVAFPPGTPAWITADLLRSTHATWQLYSPTPLSQTQVLNILVNAGRLLDILEQ